MKFGMQVTDMVIELKEGNVSTAINALVSEDADYSWYLNMSKVC